MPQTVLEAKNLKKVYNFNTANAFEALHDINFKVEEGDFVAIMGPSGSGKSTFINNLTPSSNSSKLFLKNHATIMNATTGVSYSLILLKSV